MKLSSLNFLIPAILIFCIDLYAYQAVRMVSKNAGKPVKRIIFLIYWVLTALAIAAVTYSFYRNMFLWPKPLRNFTLGMLFSLYVPKLIIVVFMLFDDLGRAVRWMLTFFKEDRDAVAPHDAQIPRSLFVSQAALVLAAIPFSGMIYGMFRGAFDYKVLRQRISYSNLPEAFDGLKILQVSDIHSGSFSETRHLKQAVDMINAQGADIIFFTGDLVNNRTDEVYPFMDVLKQMKAPMGVYSTLGNHDYGDYASWPTMEAKHQNMLDMYAVHKKLGWDLLRNENRVLERNGQKIAIAGCENWGASHRFPKYGDLHKTMARLEEVPFTVLLSHDPSHWDAQVRQFHHKADLMLAGHTHGAQFGVEAGWLKWSPIQYVYKQWAGLYRQGEQYLYVNRGLGFLAYPGRVGIRPEITLIELRRKA